MSTLIPTEKFVSECRHINKFTLSFFKKKQLIKYISSVFVRDLWDMAYITAFKELLE